MDTAGVQLPFRMGGSLPLPFAVSASQNLHINVRQKASRVGMVGGKVKVAQSVMDTLVTMTLLLAALFSKQKLRRKWQRLAGVRFVIICQLNICAHGDGLELYYIWLLWGDSLAASLPARKRLFI